MVNGENNSITEDLLIVPSDQSSWTPRAPKGSLYLEIEDYLDSIKGTERYGRPWFIDNETGKQLMVSEIRSHSRRYGALLHNHGIKPGDVVRMFSEASDTEIFFLAFGAWINGAIMSFGNPDLPADVIAKQLIDSSCKFLFVHSTHATAVKAVLNHLDKRPQLFCYGQADQIEGSVDVLKELETIAEKHCPEPKVMDVHRDTAIIMFTAGTTGPPKGVKHSHFSAFNRLSNLTSFLEGDCKVLYNSPLMLYSSALFSTTLLMHGVTIVHNFGDSNSFLDQRLIDAIYIHQPSAIYLVSGQFIHFSRSPLLALLDDSKTACVKMINPDTGAVPEVCEQRIRDAFPSVTDVLNFYGSAEVGLVSVSRERMFNKLGKLMPNTVIKIVDPATGETLGPGRRGLIRVKNSITMQGYLKKSPATKRFLDEDGFASVGDVGYYDEKGDVFLIDRLEHVIKVESHQVYPTEIESVLHRHESVRDCLVWGKTIASGNNIVSAFVQLKEGYEPSKAQAEYIRAFVNKRLTDFKRIKGEISFQDEIPRNRLGKVMRKERKVSKVQQ